MKILGLSKDVCLNFWKLERRLHHHSQQSVENLLEYYKNVENLATLDSNLARRKSGGNAKRIQELVEHLSKSDLNDTLRSELQLEFNNAIWKLPNATHPEVLSNGDQPKCLSTFNSRPSFTFEAKQFVEIAKNLNLFRMEHLGNFTGHKSYYLMNDLARLEHALIKYTIKELKKQNFNIMSVPDVLCEEIIQGCGMSTRDERNQVYKLKSNKNLCLSGTAEMSLAGYFKNSVLNSNKLPVKIAAVSRCFRAETSGLQEEKGIYRVHQFTKVEMFSICRNSESDQILNSFKNTEIDLFNNLGLHFKLLDMPACELGAPAYRKYDIEAWMPGRQMWGEISSCSNCTDYQTQRLNIQYRENNSIEFAHSVNGTACAVPRMIVSVIESYQSQDGTVTIPKVLQPFMQGQTKIVKHKSLPELKLIKKIQENVL